MTTDNKLVANVDDKLIAYLEDLSNLHLSSGEKTRIMKDLQEIINHMSTISTLDTSGATERSNPLDYTNAFREDEPGEPFGRDKILANAPEHDDEMFIAPTP